MGHWIALVLFVYYYYLFTFMQLYRPSLFASSQGRKEERRWKKEEDDERREMQQGGAAEVSSAFFSKKNKGFAEATDQLESIDFSHDLPIFIVCCSENIFEPQELGNPCDYLYRALSRP